jgi:ribonuclease HI
MIQVFFDGACAPVNPGGHMGIGAAILEDGVVIHEISHFVEAKKQNSNNVAEYMAFVNALEVLKHENLDKEEIHMMGDSKLVVMQMNNKWKIKQGYYVEHAQKSKELLRSFTRTKISWIPRDNNFIADDLSKVEFKKRGIVDISDLKKQHVEKSDREMLKNAINIIHGYLMAEETNGLTELNKKAILAYRKFYGHDFIK